MLKHSALKVQLRHHLQKKGISANALEKRAGLKSSAVQNILQGKSKQPAAALLQAIATELDCSVEDLLAPSPSQESDTLEVSSPPSSPKWHSKMYIESIHTVEDLLTKKGIELTKETILKYADEIYKYSLHRGSKTVDSHFASWLIDQYSPLKDKTL